MSTMAIGIISIFGSLNLPETLDQDVCNLLEHLSILAGEIGRSIGVNVDLPQNGVAVKKRHHDLRTSGSRAGSIPRISAIALALEGAAQSVGAIMFSGLTKSSNCSPVRSFSSMAAARRVMFLA